MTLQPSEQDALARLAAECRFDPLAWAQVAFPWGKGDLAGKELRSWQVDMLGKIGAKLQNPSTRYHPIRIAVASGHGIGKSAGMSIIANWAMTCWKRARVVVTANTDGQLRTKTSPEFAKWFNMSISAPLFDVDTTKIAIREPALQQQWRLDFTPWSEHNTEAFAGLHNEGNLIAVLMDEGSAIADKVWEVIEGALTDENTVILFIAFGNPTRNTGRFRECFRRHRELWDGVQIDSRTVEGTNKKLMDEWARTYGEDSDFFRVRVRGQFPSASSRQFISTELVEPALGRHLEEYQYSFAPVIITCDPAWTGDDELVIGFRQGLFADILEVMPKNDNDVLVAQKIAAYETAYGASAVFIDGGYGTGIKSAGDTMGRSWQLVWFSGASTDAGCLNKRAEMWLLMREWLREGGALPNDPTLFEDLIGPETLPRLDGKIALEGKEAMKRRGLVSPNRADAIALSFAAPVQNRHLVPSGREARAVVEQTSFNVWES